RDVRLSGRGHSCEDDVGNAVSVLVDDTAPCNGVMLTELRPDASMLTTELVWDLEASMLVWPGAGLDVRVFAIDMVLIPEGAYDVAESDDVTSPLRSAGGSALRIKTEDSLSVGGDGVVVYSPSDYGGDGLGPVPAAFPKGVDAFYVMRRELTDGEYAGFLDTLSGRARASRDITLHPRYRDGGGSIRVTADVVEVNEPNRPAGFVSWADGIAWAAWAGLRPMSELEFEKIVSDEQIFGVEAMLGGRWERIVTIGTPEGRAFRGSHGPGFLDDLGQPYVFSNWDWPGPRAIGSGFRGGFGDDTLTAPGDRTYAAYDATYGNEHEGFRAVRGAVSLSGQR
ncbi:MAG: SUMF1/EgtB/PvdO family nonheme iron enzyme, partial [Planctomycetota bacterium]